VPEAPYHFGANLARLVQFASGSAISMLTNIPAMPAMPTGLRHSSDDTPGFRRRARGKAFLLVSMYSTRHAWCLESNTASLRTVYRAILGFMRLEVLSVETQR